MLMCDIGWCQQSRTESAADDSQHDTSHQSTSSLPNDSTYINYEEEDDFVDDTFESETKKATGDTESGGYSSGKIFPQSCTALYDFAVSTQTVKSYNYL